MFLNYRSRTDIRLDPIRGSLNAFCLIEHKFMHPLLGTDFTVLSVNHLPRVSRCISDPFGK